MKLAALTFLLAGLMGVAASNATTAAANDTATTTTTAASATTTTTTSAASNASATTTTTTAASATTTTTTTSAASNATTTTTTSAASNATAESTTASPGVEKEVVKFDAKMEAELPTGTTGESLMSECGKPKSYCAVAKAAANTQANRGDIDIEKIEVTASSRVRQLSNTTAAKMSVKFHFVIVLAVGVDASSAVTDINTKFNAAGAQVFYTSVQTNPDVQVGGAKITIPAGQTMVASTAQKAKVTEKATGTWEGVMYKSKDCSGTATKLAGTMKQCKKQWESNAKKVSITFEKCVVGGKGLINIEDSNACPQTVASTALSFRDGECQPASDKFGGDDVSFKLHCGKAPVTAATTSDASIKSFVGVIAGLIAGLLSFM